MSEGSQRTGGYRPIRPAAFLLFAFVISLAFPEIHSRAARAASGPEAERAGAITYYRDVAPIILSNCAPCHHPGEAAPFPLLSYSDVKKHARQIVAVTQMHVMPPWLAEPQNLKFAEERRLSPVQIEMLQKWVEQQTPEGNPADGPAPPHFPVTWQLGTPDLILEAAKPFKLPASGSDVYWNFILPVPIGESRWVKAVEIRPGDKRLVHHANILVDRFGVARQSEQAPGEGFAGMDLRIESEVFEPESHFLFWKPGSAPYVEPDGLALRLDKGTDLVLNTHLQPSGKEEMVQPSVGIYFTDKPATKFPMLLQLDCDDALDIPPGEANFTVTDSFTLPVDVDLLAIYPHAHYLGKDLLAEATRPDGKKETLIHIKHWDLNWQAVYRYQEPVRLAKGTAISMRYSYDNTEENPSNPNHPAKRVVAGNRSTDEMSHLWLQVLPVNAASGKIDPRRVLQEELARHHIDRNPKDYAAHYNLAAMLEDRGDLPGGIAQYEEALRLRPDDAVIRNALGRALLSTGQAPQAIDQFQASLRARPEYFDAHYNLAIALSSQGKLEEALAQLREAVRINPNDAGAQANLGSLLAQTGRLAEAKACLERALQIDPTHQLARENLDLLNQVLAQPAR